MRESRLTELAHRVREFFARKWSREAPLEPGHLRLKLPDGTRALIRPVEPSDAAALAHALQQLSPETRYHRFLMHVERFTPAELRYLTDVDGINHLALGLGIYKGRSTVLPVAIARCIREKADPEAAEVAVVVLDEWQGRGVGSALIRSLAGRARAVGIRRWHAVMLEENQAAHRLLERVGPLLSWRRIGNGAVERIYDVGTGTPERAPGGEPPAGPGEPA